MSGIPANLDLSTLHNAEVIQVCLGVWQVQLHFAPQGSLSVECDWELTDADGRVIDRSCVGVREQPFHLHRLLQQVVVGSEVSAPRSFALRFGGGLVLRIVARTDGYESFSIQPGDVFV